MGKRLSKADLLEEVSRERAALDGLLRQLRPRQMTQAGVTAGGWSVKDILGHLIAWQQMNLSWYAAGQRGEAPAVPAPGLTWQDVRRLNALIYRKQHRRPLRDVLRDYETYHGRMLELVRVVPDRDFVQVGRYAWAGPTWSLSDYVRANTASHYRWASKHLKKWLRAQAPQQPATA
jgi:hypothetical protein